MGPSFSLSCVLAPPIHRTVYSFNTVYTGVAGRGIGLQLHERRKKDEMHATQHSTTHARNRVRSIGDSSNRISIQSASRRFPACTQSRRGRAPRHLSRGCLLGARGRGATAATSGHDTMHGTRAACGAPCRARLSTTHDTITLMWSRAAPRGVPPRPPAPSAPSSRRSTAAPRTYSTGHACGGPLGPAGRHGTSTTSPRAAYAHLRTCFLRLARPGARPLSASSASSPAVILPSDRRLHRSARNHPALLRSAPAPSQLALTSLTPPPRLFCPIIL